MLKDSSLGQGCVRLFATDKDYSKAICQQVGREGCHALKMVETQGATYGGESRDQLRLRECKDMFQGLYLNARSISKHAIELWDILDEHRPDIRLLTETWLQEHSSPAVAIAFPEEYKVSRLDRVGKRSGGLAVAIRDPHNIRVVESVATT